MTGQKSFATLSNPDERISNPYRRQPEGALFCLLTVPFFELMYDANRVVYR
jgi:hypothetical protein